MNYLQNHGNDLLSVIYENSEIGIHSINAVLPKAQDEAMRHELCSQLEHYKEFGRMAIDELKHENCEIPQVSNMTKLMIDGMTAVNMQVSNSSSHIARLMINGTNKGIISLSKEVNRASDAQKDYVSQAKKMLKTEQEYIDRLKTFL